LGNGAIDLMDVRRLDGTGRTGKSDDPEKYKGENRKISQSLCKDSSSTCRGAAKSGLKFVTLRKTGDWGRGYIEVLGQEAIWGARHAMLAVWPQTLSVPRYCWMERAGWQMYRENQKEKSLGSCGEPVNKGGENRFLLLVRGRGP